MYFQLYKAGNFYKIPQKIWSTLSQFPGRQEKKDALLLIMLILWVYLLLLILFYLLLLLSSASTTTSTDMEDEMAVFSINPATQPPSPPPGQVRNGLLNEVDESLIGETNI